MKQDSQNSQEAPPAKPKSKHVTTACTNCRRKKIKCDFNRPRCSNCVLYSQDCIFPVGIDKRKIPSKDRIAALTSHVQTLEDLLRHHGIPFQPFSNDSPFSNLEIQDAKGTPDGPPVPGLVKNHSIPESQGDEANAFNQSESWLAIENPAARVDSSPSSLHQNYSSPPPQDEGLIEQLTGRMGSMQIAEDGQKRFYGATSNLHILHNGPMSLTRSRFSSMQREGELLLQHRGLDQFVDREFEDHLLKLYFCWEDPSIHVMDEELFFREREKCKGTYEPSYLYSEVLVNAMCAIGATFTPRHRPDLPEPLDDFFAARSKALLELEMDSPSLCTVQALVILSAVEALLTRDARGWLYSGMAVRLSADLGLHLDVRQYVEAGAVNNEEARIRNLVWWGVFTHDRMWSLYVGRPVAIDDKHITAQPPASTDETTNKKCWTPYIDESNSYNPIQLNNPIEDVSKYTAELCAQMTRIRDHLYPDTQVTLKDPVNLLPFAVQLQKQLQIWYTNLPEHIKVDYADLTTYHLPHTLQLHMQYHCIMIILSRPFFSLPQSVSSPGSFSITDMRRDCVQAASSIAHILRIYRRHYTLRRINVQALHLVFTATLVLVCSACGAVDVFERETSWKSLEICTQALGEMGQALKSATRALEVITLIKAELIKQAQTKTKRRSESPAFSEYGPSQVKKRRGTEAELDPTDGFPSDAFSPIGSLNFEGVENLQNLFNVDPNEVFSADSLLWNDYATMNVLQNPQP
jgi:hypothetical protein